MKKPITNTWIDESFDYFIESLKENREDIIAMLHKRTMKCTIKFVFIPNEVPTWTLETEHCAVRLQKVTETKTELKKEINNGKEEKTSL